ncbi:MAG: glycosyltransferase [Proteobacteria bacterium]|nr:glycosyltransferase [Pseudomonadota bacterium]
MKDLKDNILGLSNLLKKVISKNDMLYLIHRFKNTFGYYPNILFPKTYNEKINYIKLFERTPLRVVVSDKYAVREYVIKKGGKKYLNELLFATNKPSDIDFAALPNSFVIKATHGSGWNIIVRNKIEMKKETIIDKCNEWLNSSYYEAGREWCYKCIQPRIIIEKLLLDEKGKIPCDYKYHCFNGKVKIIQIDIDRFGDQKRALYDEKLNKIDAKLHYSKCEKDIEFPENIFDMMRFAESLAKGFNIIRVDLFNVKGKMTFGELTNYPGNGFEHFLPAKYDRIYGDMIDL